MSSSSVLDSKAFLTSDEVSRYKPRERVGIAIEARNAQDALIQIKEAERFGVRQAWSTIGGAGRTDTLTFYAAASLETTKIRLGTSIVPIYPRHPLVMAAQALAVNDFAPNRLRLGIGPSHRHIIEQSYGIAMNSPLGYLEEYYHVLREVLWNGNVNHVGRYFKVNVPSSRKAEIPILVSALGKRAFALAGEISDGAISWLCPIPYLLNIAKPALRDGAKAKKRPAPPLVAHVLVAMTEREKEAEEVTVRRLDTYVKSPFYTRMFRNAGFPIEQNDSSSVEVLAKELLIMGSETQIKERLLKLLQDGLDEILILLVPVTDESKERESLFHLIGSL